MLLGKGAVIESNAAPTSWAYNPELPKRPFDPAKAKQPAGRGRLDARRGWHPREGRGAAGFGVMINSYDRTLEQALVVAQQSLKDVGVELTIDRVEPGVFGEPARQEGV